MSDHDHIACIIKGKDCFLYRHFDGVNDVGGGPFASRTEAIDILKASFPTVQIVTQRDYTYTVMMALYPVKPAPVDNLDFSGDALISDAPDAADDLVGVEHSDGSVNAVTDDEPEMFYSGSLWNNLEGPDVDVFVTGEIIKIGVYDGKRGAKVVIDRDEAKKVIAMLNEAVSKSEQWQERSRS